MALTSGTADSNRILLPITLVPIMVSVVLVAMRKVVAAF